MHGATRGDGAPGQGDPTSSPRRQRALPPRTRPTVPTRSPGLTLLPLPGLGLPATLAHAAQSQVSNTPLAPTAASTLFSTATALTKHKARAVEHAGQAPVTAPEMTHSKRKGQPTCWNDGLAENPARFTVDSHTLITPGRKHWYLQVFRAVDVANTGALSVAQVVTALALAVRVPKDSLARWVRTVLEEFASAGTQAGDTHHCYGGGGTRRTPHARHTVDRNSFCLLAALAEKDLRDDLTIPTATSNTTNLPGMQWILAGPRLLRRVQQLKALFKRSGLGLGQAAHDPPRRLAHMADVASVEGHLRQSSVAEGRVKGTGVGITPGRWVKEDQLVRQVLGLGLESITFVDYVAYLPIFACMGHCSPPSRQQVPTGARGRNRACAAEAEHVTTLAKELVAPRPSRGAR